jgi:tRNA threonylcarbamoyladenosine biosynthesis protein TsaE
LTSSGLMLSRVEASMKKIYLTKNPAQTKKLGETLATELLKKTKGGKRTKFSLSKEILTPHHFLKKGDGYKNKMKSGGGQKGALIIGLEGDLGGGKTTFLQGFAKGLEIKEKILSPTFIIMRRFKIRVNSCSNLCKFANFYHIDCYRIKKPEEILDLGFREAMSSPRNIIAVEWAEKIKKILPKDIIWVNFEFINKKNRRIFVTGPFV